MGGCVSTPSKSKILEYEVQEMVKSCEGLLSLLIYTDPHTHEYIEMIENIRTSLSIIRQKTLNNPIKSLEIRILNIEGTLNIIR